MVTMKLPQASSSRLPDSSKLLGLVLRLFLTCPFFLKITLEELNQPPFGFVQRKKMFSHYPRTASEPRGRLAGLFKQPPASVATTHRTGATRGFTVNLKETQDVGEGVREVVPASEGKGAGRSPAPEMPG